MDTGSNLYSTTYRGGTYGKDGDGVGGTVFKIAAAVLAAAPAQLNFGNVVAPGTSKPKKVTLINKGTRPAQISNLTTAAPFAITDSANTCSGQTIAPKKNCSFEVEFAPTTVGKVTDGSIDVTYDGTSPAVVLQGNGIAPK